MNFAGLLKDKNKLWIAVASSAALGFISGIWGYPSWHHPVEGAQALSGIVQYPFPTPFYIYEIKAWTFLHQIPALLLLSGFTEIQISQLLSGLVAALAFSSLTAAAFAVTAEAFFSIAMPFLINFTGMISYGPVYPILLMGAVTSYGIFGHFWMFLTLSFLSLKRYRIAGFILGLAPGIHIALAAMTYGIVIPSLWIWKRDLWRRILPYWIAGILVCALSYFGQPLFPGVQTIPYLKPVSKELLSQYLVNWDSHRMPVAWPDPGVWINFLAGLLAFVNYRKHQHKLPETAGFLMLCAVVASLVGFLGMIISWIPVEKVPTFLLRLMPARVINFNILLFPILAIGTLKVRRGLVAQILTTFAITYFLIIARFEQYFSHAAVFFIGIGSLALAFGGWKIFEQAPAAYLVNRIFRFFQASVLGLLILKFTLVSVQRYPYRLTSFIDWRNEPLLATVNKGRGVLLLGPDFSAMQLVTRRPILIDGGALDIISYFPELAGSINTIMTEVYGISLFHPPSEILHVAIMPDQFTRPIWEARSQTEWLALGKKFGFTEILTSGWNLKLPLTAQNESYKFYSVS